MKKLFFAIFLLSAGVGLKGQSFSITDYRWTPVDAKGDVVGRHENGFIEYKKKFYLIGGRGVNPVNVFDPATNTWETKGKSPMEIHHFQAVVYGNAGVQIRSRYFEKDVVEGGIPGWLDGPQVDIEPVNPWRTGLIYDETRTEKRWIAPSLTDWKVTKENTTHKRVIFYFEDENSGWNDMMIVCKGTNIKTFVNNFLVSDLYGAGLLDSEGHKKYNVGLKGHIALQLHKNSENKIWFKDIEIRELNY